MALGEFAATGPSGHMLFNLDLARRDHPKGARIHGLVTRLPAHGDLCGTKTFRVYSSKRTWTGCTTCDTIYPDGRYMCHHCEMATLTLTTNLSWRVDYTIRCFTCEVNSYGPHASSSGGDGNASAAAF